MSNSFIMKRHFVIFLLLFLSVANNAQKVLRGNFDKLFSSYAFAKNEDDNANYWKILFVNHNDQQEWFVAGKNNVETVRTDSGLCIRNISLKKDKSFWMWHYFPDIDCVGDIITFKGRCKAVCGHPLISASITTNEEKDEAQDSLRNGDFVFSVSIPFRNIKVQSCKIPIISIRFQSNIEGEAVELYDMDVQIDGISIRERHPYPLANADHEFDTSSKFVFKNGKTLSDTEVERLTKLCLIWGFLKYYHPQVRSAHYDWNYQLFRMLKSIDADDFEGTVCSMIPPFHMSFGKQANPDEILIKLKKDWLCKDLLGKKIFKKLSLLDVKNIPGLPYCTGYIFGDTKVGLERGTEFINETSYDNIPVTDDGYRVLALFRFWNMMYYFHPYMYQMEDMWIRQLPDWIRLFAKADSDADFDAACTIVACALKDTHTELYGLKTNVQSDKIWEGKGYLPVDVEMSGDTAVLIKKFKTEKMMESGLMPGDMITEVNGRTIKEIRQEKSIYSNFEKPSTDQFALSYIGLPNNQAVYKVLRADSVFEIIIDSPYKYWEGTMQEVPDTVRWIGDDIAYINLICIRKDTFNSVFPKLKDKKGIIFDMRGYPGEDIESILARLLNPHKTPIEYFSYSDMQNPGTFRKTSYIEYAGEDNPDYFKGVSIVLVNGKTMSQSERLALLIKSAPQGYVIGEPTGGVMGRAVGVPFTSGRAARFTSPGVYFMDGSCSFPNGIPLDEEVYPNPVDLRKGDDTLIKRAIEIIRSE